MRQPPHRLGPHKEEEAERQVRKLLKQGLIEPANSAWSSPVVLVKRKDGSWRFCVDYRKLNAITLQDAYPIPRIDESLDALSGSKLFSTLDLTSGYWQVPLDPDAQDKSAFATRTGLWKWKVLPFGLTSAPATFQRLMEQVLQGLHWKTLLLYLDDIIVVAPDFQTHLQRLEEVLGRLQKAGLKLKPGKCELLQHMVRYLGHIVSEEGVATDPAKVEAMKDWPPPKEVKELQAFLGMTGYYRQYIPDYATIAKPLTQLIGKDTLWRWGEEAQGAFDQLKEGLTTAPVLGYPDPGKTYILDTDASAVGVGAVLSQVQEGQERVIAYFSKTLSPAERNYCVTRRELLAVIKSVKHFRPYLYGRTFQLRTDHASLRWLCRRKESLAQVARWLEILAEFRYSLEHRSGHKHGNADGLSRKRQCQERRQCEAIEKRDGGPSREELEGQTEWPGSLGFKAAGTPTPATLAYIAQTKKGDKETGPGQLGPGVAKVLIGNQDRDDTLAKEQNSGGGPVHQMYQVIEQGGELSREELQAGCAELRTLYKKRGAMRINEKQVLEIRLNVQNQTRWCAVCPSSYRKGSLWDTHRLAHSGINRTLARLQLSWYWPGMTAEVRRAIKTCEVCQVTKPGGTHPAGSKQRLFAGRPWQKVAVDLAGPMPETSRILVLMDHFTRWQDAIALPNATAETVATALDERVFCYFGLPEQLHTDQGAQFESQLMTELCTLWGVRKTHTTPYHPQANGIVERHNRGLGDSLRALLLNKGQEEWDTLLPQIMRAFRGTPHSTTGETANSMMMGRELRLPDLLQNAPCPSNQYSRHDFVQLTKDRLDAVHNILRERQKQVRQEDTEEPLLFARGDLVLLENRRRRKKENPKLQPKFVGPYEVQECYPNHTYVISKQGQDSVQNECRLKLYTPCIEIARKAPTTLEPSRRPNMKGATHPRTSNPREVDTTALEQMRRMEGVGKIPLLEENTSVHTREEQSPQEVDQEPPSLNHPKEITGIEKKDTFGKFSGSRTSANEFPMVDLPRV